MQWQDHAIILGVKRLGESSVVAEVMTRARGRHMGLVRSGRSRAMQPVLQAGNLVELTWRARLHEHLGEFRMEPVTLRAARLMETATAVYGVQAMAALLRLLPERDPHPHLYDALDVILENLQNPADAGELFVRFELAVLNDLGFGLDLTECAATGVREDLAFVSPKSGRAVCRAAGMPWADKMLALPPFLTTGTVIAADRESLAAAFRLTGFFLHRHVYEPRGIEIAAARDGFMQAAMKAVALVSEEKPAGATIVAIER
ncbi:MULTISPECIES: DNA repair protein RecO [unclassified Rhizobium]|jgi:DNA repair protein RecO (recombination protein O)|uniref:DNA repair protein RecO n=1 Tax=unclassified Rhizobium TaxID=2613769 RepID=UPI0006471027|nr:MULTISPECIES: DNA repair protein RecO [unclassified Rhizobium]MBN8951057.1 DNA repair protein RecO [Rhizobium tropici]OJY69187.1 MAG: DNA repair protein RecO [Rhizobium sp. 60-20]RKD73928.1 DNA replication and repair protein RecO [Rhizobium sp. WW_1]